MKANSVQFGGKHYLGKAIQPWDYILANKLGYLEGNIVKYVSRWRDKGGIEDLRKARHYCEKLLEMRRSQSFITHWWVCVTAYLPKRINPALYAFSNGVDSTEAAVIACVTYGRLKDVLLARDIISHLISVELGESTRELIKKCKKVDSK